MRIIPGTGNWTGPACPGYIRSGEPLLKIKMYLRPYHPKDVKEINKMLHIENVKRNGINRLSSTTYVLDAHGEVIGFFTLKMQKGIPFLLHFLSKRNNTGSVKRPMLLVKHFTRFLKSNGHKRLIINLSANRPEACAFTEKYCRRKIVAKKLVPWKYSDGSINPKLFYLVKV